MGEKISRRELFNKAFEAGKIIISGYAFNALDYLSNDKSYTERNETVPKVEIRNKVYLPFNGKRNLKEAIVMGTGIIDDNLISELYSYIKPKLNPEMTKRYLEIDTSVEIPENYMIDKVGFDADGRIVFPKFQLRTVLNVPAYRWDIYQRFNHKDYLLASWPVVVGRPRIKKKKSKNIIKNKTPLGHFYLTTLEHYPSWVNPENTKQVIGPGKHNPLGIWKVKTDNAMWYYHGTNQESIFRNKERLFSHGCVRNKNWNIAKIAILLLTRNANKPEIYDNKYSQIIKLNDPIDALNIYDTVEVRNNNLVFYPNVYHLSFENKFVHLTNMNNALYKLHMAGYNLQDISRSKLEKVVKRARHISKRLEYPVSHLTKVKVSIRESSVVNAEDAVEI